MRQRNACSFTEQSCNACSHLISRIIIVVLHELVRQRNLAQSLAELAVLCLLLHLALHSYEVHNLHAKKNSHGDAVGRGYCLCVFGGANQAKRNNIDARSLVEKKQQAHKRCAHKHNYCKGVCTYFSFRYNCCWPSYVMAVVPLPQKTKLYDKKSTSTYHRCGLGN